MNSILLGISVTICLCLAALGGLFIRAKLPDHHLHTDSKEVIRLATAVVGTLSALALGLLIASAKTANDNAQLELRSSSARIVLLDRLMEHYGSETEPSRYLLRHLLEARLDRGWVPASAIPTGNTVEEVQDLEAVQTNLRRLVPTTQEQRLVQARALEVSGTIAEAHWLLAETDDETLPWAFLLVLVFWLALLFVTFGLQAPPNPTLICILIVCAISVGGAIFVIADMANPYIGLIHISDTPLREALAMIEQN